MTGMFLLLLGLLLIGAAMLRDFWWNLEEQAWENERKRLHEFIERDVQSYRLKLLYAERDSPGDFPAPDDPVPDPDDTELPIG